MFDDLESDSQQNNMARIGQNNIMQPQVQPQPTQNQVEDMFSETDKLPKPSPLKPKQELNNLSEFKTEKENGVMKKIAFFAILIIAVAVITVGTIYIFKKIDKSMNGAIYSNLENVPVENTENQTDENQEIQNPAENQTDEALLNEGTTTPDNLAENPLSENNSADFFPPESAMNPNLDSDQDGLTDQEEISFGTDVNNHDTDNDELYDREEIKVYKSNPIVSDTDGDGYLDGDEVKNGYNPVGSGKLNEIK